MLKSLLNPVLGLHGWEAYLIVAILCFGEAALLIGFVLPGETAVVLGGVLASEHHVALVTMIIVVVVAAVLGDTVGYIVGRRFGPVLLRHRPLVGRPGVDKARDFVDRRGSLAVFIGRFTAVFRALVPGIAGISAMSYPRFALANAAGGIIWGIGFTIAGYEVGDSYKRFLDDASTASTVLICVVVALLVAFVVRRRVNERREVVRARAAEKSEAAE